MEVLTRMVVSQMCAGRWWYRARHKVRLGVDWCGVSSCKVHQESAAARWKST
jgi:hypothetical protein